MIGDWVIAQFIDGNRYARVYSIAQDCVVISLCLRECDHDYDAIFPIKLTEDILKKNGFVENKGAWWLKSELFTLNEFIKGGYCSSAFHEQVIINYVHELQHALRMCGLNEFADNFKV